MAEQCRIDLLGQLRVRVGTSETTRFRSYKTGALLAYLAYRLDRPVPREELIEMLWPESTDEQARNSLSQSLSSLRNQLEAPGSTPGSVLEANRHTVRLLAESCVTDVARFRALAKAAEQAHSRSDEARWESLALEAVAAFDGEFLPGYYEDWTIAPREHLREEVLGILDKLVSVAQSRGQLREALDLALKATVIDPTRELSHQAVIRIYDALGQPDAAVKQFRECERALWTGLGIKPSEATRNLARASLQRERPDDEVEPLAAAREAEVTGTPTWIHALTAGSIADASVVCVRPGLWRSPSPAVALTFGRRVLRADPTAQISITTGPKADTVPAELAASGQVICDPPTAALDPEPWIDLGLHEGPRGPVRLYASKETVRNTNAVRSAPLGTLSPSNSYFGRETELAGVAALLSGERRLVTLTGPGGMGKTRLSQEVARIVAPVYPSGVVFVRLEDIFLGQQIWDAIASALKIVANPNSPVQEQVIAVMQGGRWLLVLDNFEQLCDAGGPDVVNTILQTLPETSILVSSRRRLAVEGEVESPLPPLPSPDGGDDLETLARSPSVALFLDRARSARPDFQLTASNRADVVSLCERLDGIPLALELAAARAQVLTPGQILDRFDQRLDILTSRAKGERHKSLRNAIDWTYSMLPDDLQTAFRRLSVFRGGWDEQAAETVLDSPVTLDLLADLREVSLVSSFEDSGGAMRFHMLETLRDYARKAADEAEWSESRERHCRAFVDRVEQCESKLEGKEQVAVLNGLEADRANIAAAVEWAIENSQADLALRICAAAWRFWHLKSHISEGRSLCQAALAVEGGGAVFRARAMNGNGRLSYLQGDYEESRTLHQEAIRLGGHEPTVRAMSLNALGAVAYETGQYLEAVSLFEESLDIRRQIGDEFGIGNVLSWLGIVYTDQSRYDDARRVLEESLEVRERIGDVSGTARALNSLGIVARRLSEWKTASDCYERALEIQRQMGDRRAIAGLLSNLGMIAQSSGDTERAVELFQESQRINVELGDKWGTATVLANQASLALEAGDLSRSLELNGEALRLRHEIGNQWGIAYSMEGCAQALLAAGRPEEGAKALGCAAKVRASVGSPLPPVDQCAVDETTERIKAEVGEARFDECFSAGHSASVDESVAQILASLLS